MMNIFKEIKLFVLLHICNQDQEIWSGFVHDGKFYAWGPRAFFMASIAIDLSGVVFVEFNEKFILYS